MFPRLKERRSNFGNQLSGGEQQMLAIGRALTLNPKVLLLDEPTEGLAPIIVEELLRALGTITRAGGICSIIVEQNAQKILGLADRLIGPDDAPFAVDVHDTGQGMVARATLPADRTDGLLDRVRHRLSESGCGLCGVENLEQAMRPLPPVTAQSRADPAAIFRALGELAAHQPLNAATGAAHVAAFVGVDGTIGCAREDVGRHNAFDKLIGAMKRAGTDWDGGFALLSSRCSYELVEKAVLSGCPLLVTISAPTALAAQRAEQAGLPLVVLARPDALLHHGNALRP